MCGPFRREAQKRNEKFPQEFNTLTYNAKEIILTSPLIQFYQEIGMKISNVVWAIEYVKGQPFEKFVSEMVELRIKSHETGNTALGTRAKFSMNSTVGR